MKVSELIEQLQKLPKDSNIYWADLYCSAERTEDNIPLYALYDYNEVEIKHMSQVRSCRSMAPWENSIIENIIVIEKT